MPIHVVEDLSPLCIILGVGWRHYASSGRRIGHMGGTCFICLHIKGVGCKRSRYPLDGWREQFHNGTEMVLWFGMSC